MPPTDTEAPEKDQDTPQTPDNEQAPDDQDTSSESTDQDTPQDIDWQERYRNLESDHTRAAQEAAQYRQIIDAARYGDPKALELLGLEAADAGEDDDEDADEPLTRSEFMQFLQEQQGQVEESAAEDAWWGDVEEQVAGIDPDGKLSDGYLMALVSLGEQLASDDGRADIKAAHEQLQREFEAQRKAYVESKRAPQAPGGGSGQHEANLDDAREREEYMVSRMTDPGITA